MQRCDARLGGWWIESEINCEPTRWWNLSVLAERAHLHIHPCIFLKASIKKLKNKYRFQLFVCMRSISLSLACLQIFVHVIALLFCCRYANSPHAVVFARPVNLFAFVAVQSDERTHTLPQSWGIPCFLHPAHEQFLTTQAKFPTPLTVRTSAPCYAYICYSQRYIRVSLLGNNSSSLICSSFLLLLTGLRLAEQLARREDEAKIRHRLGLSLWASGNLEEAQHQVEYLSRLPLLALNHINFCSTLFEFPP